MPSQPLLDTSAKAAEAAESRVADAPRMGIGDLEKVQSMQSELQRQRRACIAGIFSASRAAALRRLDLLSPKLDKRFNGASSRPCPKFRKRRGCQFNVDVFPGTCRDLYTETDVDVEIVCGQCL